MPWILFLSRSDLEPLLGMKEVLNYVEEAYALYAKSKAGQNQASFSPMVAFHTKIPNSDIDYRAGTMDPIPSLCSVLGFGYGDNPSKYGISGLYAIGILSRLESGVPAAVMEAEYLANMRTGAAAAISSKHLAKKDPRVLGFIGTGNLARHMLNAHIQQYGTLEEVRAWSRNRETRENFASEMSRKYGVSVKPVENPKEAVEGVNIVYCCSRAKEPKVLNEWVSPGTHINAFGADAPGKQEVDPKVLVRAKIVVDSLDQCRIGGEIHKPLAEGVISEKDVYAEIGEIINGWKKGRQSEDEVTVMDSTGLSALDIVTFHRAYERALDKGVGTWLRL